MKVSLTAVFVKGTLTPQPKIKCSLVINEDLTFSIFAGGKRIHQSRVSNFCSSALETCTQIVNVLAFLGSEHDSSSGTDKRGLIQTALHAMKDQLTSCDETEAEKLQFPMEQMLTFQELKKMFRSLTATASIWHSISPSAYRRIRDDGLLMLPSKVVQSIQRGRRCVNDRLLATKDR